MPTPNLMLSTATTTGGDVPIGIISACALVQLSFPTGACGVCFFVKKMSGTLIQLGNKK